MVNEILDLISKGSGLSREDILGKSRKSECVKNRLLLANLLRFKLRMSLSEIGEVLNKDHSTIIYYISTYDSLVSQDKIFCNFAEEINKKLIDMLKRNKYGSKKVIIDDIVFDSKKEGERWKFLCNAQKEGQISDLERQVKVELIPSIKEEVEVQLKTKTKLKERTVQLPITYICDFRYTMSDGSVVYEDVKATPKAAALDKVFLLKEKLFRYKMGFPIKRVYVANEQL